MAALDFKAFDADHHYYEAEDAFIRHVEPPMQRRCMQWAEIGGRQRLLVGGRVNRFIPNPTFDPVAKPGSLDDFFRGKNPDNKNMAELFGRLDPIDPAYRDRDVRLGQLEGRSAAHHRRHEQRHQHDREPALHGRGTHRRSANRSRLYQPAPRQRQGAGQLFSLTRRQRP